MKKIEFALEVDYNIYKLLKKKKGQWLFADEIAKAIGFKPQGGYIRNSVHRLRRMGIPIASDVNKGYRYVTKYKDVAPTVRWFQNKARDHSKTAQSLMLIFEMKDQQRLF